MASQPRTCASYVLTKAHLRSIPDETANRMMLVHGSGNLLAAIEGRPMTAPGMRAEPRERPARPAVTPDMEAPLIIEAVASAFGVWPAEMKSDDRFTDLVLARSVAIRLLRERTTENGEPRHSFREIGDMLGGRDHTTIGHAWHTFHERAERYPEMGEAYEMLRGAAA